MPHRIVELGGGRGRPRREWSQYLPAHILIVPSRLTSKSRDTLASWYVSVSGSFIMQAVPATLSLTLLYTSNLHSSTFGLLTTRPETLVDRDITTEPTPSKVFDHVHVGLQAGCKSDLDHLLPGDAELVCRFTTKLIQ